MGWAFKNFLKQRKKFSEEKKYQINSPPAGFPKILKTFEAAYNAKKMTPYNTNDQL